MDLTRLTSQANALLGDAVLLIEIPTEVARLAPHPPPVSFSFYRIGPSR